MKTVSKLSSQSVLYGAFYGTLIAFLYYPSYDWLVRYDWPREDYNYCYLIPFVVFYLAWDKRSKWIQEASIPSWGGLFALVPGVLLYWVGALAGEFFSIYISSWLVVTGLIWLHKGWLKLKIMAFPICVSLFLFPLPHFINTKLTFNLKLISSEIGITMIQALGMSAYREGNVIDLGFTQLQVVDACSGLRYMIPLFLMGLLMAYFYNAATWKKIVITLTTIPLSIITNSFRIAMTAALYPYMGPTVAEGFFHDFSGWAIFMVSFIIILIEIWVLGKIMRQPDESFLKKEGVAEKKNIKRSGYMELSNPGAETKKAAVQFVIAASMLAATVMCQPVIDFDEKPPVSRSFSTFPLVVGGWKGERQFLDQPIIDELDLSDYVSVNYAKEGSRPVNLYVAYYESQQKGKSIHSPETCLPGSGWIFNNGGTLTIPVPGNIPSSLTVMRAVMEKGGERKLVYFWFNQRGRILTNAYELKIYNLWDGLIQKRTDGALVRVISPVVSSETIGETDSRLQSFVREMIPSLNGFIPGKDEVPLGNS